MASFSGSHGSFRGTKKNIDFFRSVGAYLQRSKSDANTFKQSRHRRRKMLRKSASLPVTPESEHEHQVLSELAHAVTYNGELSSIPAASLAAPKKSKMDVMKAGSKDIVLVNDSPMLSKSRTEKFHKLFKAVPDHEFPIDYFSCAFLGDILLQGNLYVSQNWFCFYSRIKGRGRLLEIPMTKVISITREKTAIIFPNAIGLQTAEEKFAFGSFISRDSTYRFLVSVWKKSQELQAVDSLVSSEGGEQEVTFQDNPDNDDDDDEEDDDEEDDDDVDESPKHNNNLIRTSHSNSKTESTDQSDISLCLECGSVDPSDTTDNVQQHSILGAGGMGRKKAHGHAVRVRASVSPRAPSRWTSKLRFPYSLLQCLDCQKTLDAFWKSAMKLQRIPRTNLLLTICTALVLFLLLSAVGLTYKILDLEAKLEAQGVWTITSQQDYRDKSFTSMMNLQSQAQRSTAQHMQTVLRANIAVLEEINYNLKHLQTSTKSSVYEHGECDRDDGCS